MASADSVDNVILVLLVQTYNKFSFEIESKNELKIHFTFS